MLIVYLCVNFISCRSGRGMALPFCMAAKRKQKPPAEAPAKNRAAENLFYPDVSHSKRHQTRQRSDNDAVLPPSATVRHIRPAFSTPRGGLAGGATEAESLMAKGSTLFRIVASVLDGSPELPGCGLLCVVFDRDLFLSGRCDGA
ncbi:MAG: hypothetical protein P4M02_00070, partial [Clostridia bacterium]|nr:hypothetical protein [Clostridia bacterium]